MLREYLESTKLGMIEALFEKIESGATIKEIQAALPRNSKYPTKHIDELIARKIVICDNPEAPENERIYHGNRNSIIFRSLFTVDVELSDMEHERKKQLRKQMLYGPKKEKK